MSTHQPNDGGSTPRHVAPHSQTLNPNSGPIESAPTLVSSPTTPGEAEGTENVDDQSQTSPAPSQLDPAEG